MYLFLLDLYAPAGRSCDSLLDLLKVTITAIVCVAPSSSAKPSRHTANDNPGRESGGALGWRLSVKQELKTLYTKNIDDTLKLLNLTSWYASENV